MRSTGHIRQRSSGSWEILPRRQFLVGLASLIAAPAVVKYANLMPVRGIVEPIDNPMLLSMHPDLYAELCDVTRKAFLPSLYVKTFLNAPYGKGLLDFSPQ